MMPSDDRAPVTLYAMLPTRDANHPYDPARPYAVAQSIKRDLTIKDMNLFGEVKIKPGTRMIQLFTETITAGWDVGFDPWALEPETEWLIKEVDLTEWSIENVLARMNESEWWCLCTRVRGDAIIA